MKRNQSQNMGRRRFLKIAGAATAAWTSAGILQQSSGTARADDTPEKPELSLGFIPLTDCAPLIIASEKGIYKKYGLNVHIKKMASWGATRDAIQKGEIDGAHI